MKGTLSSLFIVLFWTVSAQRINNSALYRNIGSRSYFRLHYENDYFSNSDRYYTQGINLEFVHPSIGRFFTSKLLLHGSASRQSKFGISLEHEGYTPTTISHAEVLTGDRPFAASVFLKTFSIVNDSSRKARLSSDLSFGVIGPAAGGQEIQQTIHRWIHYRQPQGWENQIHNDLILNYQIAYEKRLFYTGDYLLISGKLAARAGTYQVQANGGLIFMAGLFDNPFTCFTTQKKKRRVYLFAEPLFTIVGYDATLQGGIFNRTSPYWISAQDITRIVYQLNTGIVFNLNRVQLEYFQSFLTKEFTTGLSHQWGGVRIGYSLK